MIESIKRKMQEVNEMCTTNGNCGNTAMHIQVETQGGCENNKQPGAPPCPNAKACFPLLPVRSFRSHHFTAKTNYHELLLSTK